MYKVSVIIPIYNTGQYIEKCANSLFNQTLDNIEYIFVNDCTPDNAIERLNRVIDSCKTLINRSNSIVRIINLPRNMGLAAARRVGILEAKGEYIINCDSDDWVDLDFYQKLYNKATEGQYDVVIGALADVFSPMIRPRGCYSIESDGKSIIHNQYKDPIHLSLCNKLIISSLLKRTDSLPIIGLNMWEDNCVMYRVLYYAQRVATVDDTYYYYYHANESSITSMYNENYINQMLGVAQVITDFYKKRPDFSNFANSIYSLQYIAKLSLIYDSFGNYRRFMNTFKESDHYKRIVSYSNFSRKGKIRFFFVKHHMAIPFILLVKIANLFIKHSN